MAKTRCLLNSISAFRLPSKQKRRKLHTNLGRSTTRPPQNPVRGRTCRAQMKEQALSPMQPTAVVSHAEKLQTPNRKERDCSVRGCKMRMCVCVCLVIRRNGCGAWTFRGLPFPDHHVSTSSRWTRSLGSTYHLECVELLFDLLSKQRSEPVASSHVSATVVFGTRPGIVELYARAEADVAR